MSNIRQTLHLADELRAASPDQLIESLTEVFDPAPSDIPVLVCARNEAHDLPATLAALACSTERVHPVVVDNGSDDDTAEIAALTGATVIDEPYRSKTAAFQTGLKFITEELKTGILLSTDADSIPSRSWVASTLRCVSQIDPQRGGIVFGPVAMRHGPSRQTDRLRTLLLNAKQGYNLLTSKAPGSRGNNMAIRLDNDGAVANELWRIPIDTFPGADRAQRDAVALAGGELRVIFSPNALVVSRGDRFSSISQYIMAQLQIITPEQLYREPADTTVLAPLMSDHQREKA